MTQEPKTDEEYAKEIEVISGNPEGGHIRADEILIEIARRAGFNKTADAFEAMEKWYA